MSCTLYIIHTLVNLLAINGIKWFFFKLILRNTCFLIVIVFFINIIINITALEDIESSEIVINNICNGSIIHAIINIISMSN